MPITMDDLSTFGHHKLDEGHRFKIIGKKCCIWENTRYRAANVGRYEVFSLDALPGGGKMPNRFPSDTPLYKEYGWDDLEEAKVFFLLQEI